MILTNINNIVATLALIFIIFIIINGGDMNFYLALIIYSLCIFIFPVTILCLMLNDKKTDASWQPFAINIVDFITTLFVAIISDIFRNPSSTERISNFPFLFIFFSNALFFIPFLISRYFSTIHYTHKNQHYYIAFIFSVGLLLTGLLCYFNNIGRLEQILPFAVVLFFFLPIFIIYICIYFRIRGKK